MVHLSNVRKNIYSALFSQVCYKLLLKFHFALNVIILISGYSLASLKSRWINNVKFKPNLY